MQPARPTQGRAPGSFSPLPGNSNTSAGADLSRPRLRRIDTSPNDDQTPLAVPKPRNHSGAQTASGSPATPIYTSFTHSNGSTSSLQNFSRPTLSTALSAARSVANTHSPSDATPRNGPSPLTFPPTSATSTSGPGGFSSRLGHSRKHSQSAGMFEPTLPSTSTSSLSQIGLSQISFGQSSPKMNPSQHRELSASQIAAQAAVMNHNQQQQQQQQQQQLQHAQVQALAQAHQQHARQRSQTVPTPGLEHEASSMQNKRISGGPLSPPMLSLTEASAPRESTLPSQTYHNGLPGNHNLAAATAANLVFPRSSQSSPGLPNQAPPPVPPPPPKPEKTKVKLFSRPGRIGVKGDPKEKPLPSPAKIGHALSNLQRANFSTTSLDSSSQSFYSLANSSTATIRAADAPPLPEKDGKEKEKKHHFLSRQKQKLKEDFHLPLSSASSNSRPTDPNAPNSLYNFNLPQSPGPHSNSFKSGLDLRHGGRALREKKKEEKGIFDDAASSYNMGPDWPGPSSVNSGSGTLASALYMNEPFDSSKYGLNNMTVDDAWPFLKAKLLIIFQGEELRLPIEDLNRIVTMHIQYCLARRSPNIIVEDLRELLTTGFSSLDRALMDTPDDRRLIPSLVELWIFTFTVILPYLQAVFLPLDTEFAGHGPLMTTEQARDFWGGIPARRPSLDATAALSAAVTVSPASSVLEVRRIVLLSFRDIVILPRYETLKSMFSRLSLEFLPQSLASLALASPPIPVPSPGFHSQNSQYQNMLSSSPAESQASLGLSSVPGTFVARPGTAMSLDPSLASYNSTSTTLLGDTSGSGNRSRAISNVSFGSDNTNSTRPYTPSSLHALGGSGSNLSAGGGGSNGTLRDQNVEDSKQVTEMIGRMLQCMSVLASVGVGGSSSSDDANRMVEELNKLLKLNWLGRGRTGRNRRGIVGGRVKRAGGIGGLVMPGGFLPSSTEAVREGDAG